MPFLERVRAPEHACTIDYHHRHVPSASAGELPDFKTLLEDINGGGGGSTADGPLSLRGWNPLSASRCSPGSLPGDEPTNISHGVIGDDAVFNADSFQPLDPFNQDQWTLPKLFQADIDDDVSYVSVNSGQDVEGRRRIEYVASSLGISPGQSP